MIIGTEGRELLTKAAAEIKQLTDAIAEMAADMLKIADPQHASDHAVESGLRISCRILNHLYGVMDDADTDPKELGIASVLDEVRSMVDPKCEWCGKSVADPNDLDEVGFCDHCAINA